MKTAMYENYKPTRELGKRFLHRDITGEMWCRMWFGVGVGECELDCELNTLKKAKTGKYASSLNWP